MSYTIRRPDEVLGEFPTLGDALRWANAHPEPLPSVGVFWGDRGSSMSFEAWRTWANHTVSKLERQGLPTAALLASRG